MFSPSRPPTSHKMQLKFRPPTDLLSPSPCSPLSSCLASPSLASVSEDSDDGSDMGYFRRELAVSPVPDYASDVDSDGASDETLEGTEIFAKIGYPLERIPGRRDCDVIAASDSEQELGRAIICHPGATCSSCSASSSYSPSPVTSSLTNYQEIIDDLVNVAGNPFDELDPQNFVTYNPSPSASFSSLALGPSLMIKRVPRSSVELSVILELNSSELRKDPWNPCPHLLQVVNSNSDPEYVYLCMERLSEYNVPAMSTVAQYIDFFRQVLEGLSFLHERNLVSFSCSDPNSYMVDLSSGPLSNNASSVALAPTSPSRGQAQGTSTPLKTNSGHRYNPHHHYHRHHRHLSQGAHGRFFDRSMYPVRYYFVNFSHTRRMQDDAPLLRDRTTSTPPPSSAHFLPPIQISPFKQDVKDLGTMIDRMLNDLPNVANAKFKALIKAMTTGGFGAEDSRKLFEALCRSLEAEVFEMPVKTTVGMRSHSSEVLTSGGTSGAGGLGLRVLSKIKGDFGLEPERVALSS